MLRYDDGRLFSTGSMGCELRLLSGTRDAIRIIVPISLGGLQFTAVVDTGGVYAILDPGIAQVLRFDPASAIGQDRLTIRRSTYSGRLYRMEVVFLADEGLSLEREMTVFVPDVSAEEWGGLPCFLGLTGCLEHLRFAVDPSPQAERFHFGEL
jgi:hypothetical protein